MRILTPLRATLALAVALTALAAPASAQLYVSIGAPPLLPTYTQPQVPAPGMTWMPGYWAWGPNGYYWVPGTWVYPPDNGLYWTPGYWGAANNGFMWNQGYWAPQVGFYGGVNYGAGYYGTGYVGGMWQGPNFLYNTAVTAVPSTIQTVYVNRTVVVHTVNRVSFNGGRLGIHVRPTPAQIAVLRMRRVMLTPAQRLHIAEAARDRNMLVKVNGGHPTVVVVRRPLTVTNRPPGFKPVTTVHVAAPVNHPVTVTHPAPKPAQPAPHAAPAKPPSQSQNHQGQNQMHQGQNGQGQNHQSQNQKNQGQNKNNQGQNNQNKNQDQNKKPPQ